MNGSVSKLSHPTSRTFPAYRAGCHPPPCRRPIQHPPADPARGLMIAPHASHEKNVAEPCISRRKRKRWRSQDRDFLVHALTSSCRLSGTSSWVLHKQINKLVQTNEDFYLMSIWIKTRTYIYMHKYTKDKWTNQWVYIHIHIYIYRYI